MLKNKPKNLIAIDLDGTLLPKTKIISENSKNFLKNLESAGNLVVLASGRGYRNLLQYYDDIGLKSSPIVAHNGLYISHPKDIKFPVFCYEFDKELLNGLVHVMRPYATNIYYENLHGIYIEKPDEKLQQFFHYQDKPTKVGPLGNEISDTALTLVFGLPVVNYKKEEITKKLKELYPEVEIRFWCDEKYCEIYKKENSKGACIDKIAEIYDIDKKNIYAFGDNDNDLEIISAYPHSYLMKNGSDQMKPLAVNITEFSNEEDGVIKELQKHFKL